VAHTSEAAFGPQVISFLRNAWVSILSEVLRYEDASDSLGNVFGRVGHIPERRREAYVATQTHESAQLCISLSRARADSDMAPHPEHDKGPEEVGLWPKLILAKIHDGAVDKSWL